MKHICAIIGVLKWSEYGGECIVNVYSSILLEWRSIISIIMGIEIMPT